MKRIKTLLTVLVIVFGITSWLNAKGGQHKIRFTAGIGTTSSVDVNIGTGNKTALRIGGTGLYRISKLIGVGVDLGFVKAYKQEFNNFNFTVSYFTLLTMIEFNLLKNDLLIFQIGQGGYMATGNNTGSEYGLRLGGGVDIPVGSNISIPILFRTDFIFASDMLVPITINAGITIKIK